MANLADLTTLAPAILDEAINAAAVQVIAGDNGEITIRALAGPIKDGSEFLAARSIRFTSPDDVLRLAAELEKVAREAVPGGGRLHVAGAHEMPAAAV